MDQIKIGNFLSELRKGKRLTQEQLATKLNVARRTVSRWETGSNLPDIDILIELSDLYSVDLREILDGERRNGKMEEEMKETILRVAEYENEGKKRSSRVVIVYSVLGIIALIANVVMSELELPETFLTGFLEGATLGIAVGAMILSIIFATGTMSKLYAAKKRLVAKQGK